MKLKKQKDLFMAIIGTVATVILSVLLIRLPADSDEEIIPLNFVKGLMILCMVIFTVIGWISSIPEPKEDRR